MYVKVRRCVSRLAFKMSSREVLRGFNRMATCTRISATSEAKAFGVGKDGRNKVTEST
jgi:hypothetical protein